MMSGENLLNILILTSSVENNKLFLHLLSSTGLKNSKTIFCNNFPEAEVELMKSEFNFVVFFSDDSSFNPSKIESWVKTVKIEIPSLILYSGKSKSNNKKNIDYYEISKFTAELLEKIISSALEKQEILLQLESKEEKWSYFNSLSNDIVWEWELEDHSIKYSVSAFSKIFGKDMNKGRMPYSVWLDFVAAEDRERVKNFFTEIIHDPNKMVFELDYKMKVNGKLAFLNEKGYIKRDKKGVAQSAIGVLQNITQKITGEKEIKRLSHIAEETLNGVLLTDADGHITWCNKSFIELSGYNLEEVYGKKPGNVLQGPETSKIAIRFMSGKLKKSKSFKCDLLNYKKSGEKYWVRIFCQPQFDDNGKLDSYFSILADISFEREAHQKLLDNEKKYRALIEYSKDGLSIISSNPRTVDILAGKDILGYSNEDYYNSPPESYIHPDDINLVNSAFFDIMHDPSKSESREYRAYKKEVGYIWIESTFHNMLNVPSVNGIVANFRDINDRKLSEELLRSSEEKYRILFNENPLALIVWDPKTYLILEVNEMACKEYGYSRKEFIGLNTKKIIFPELVPRFVNYAAGLSNQTAAAISYSSINVKKDGSLIYIDITFQPFNYFGVKASVAMIKNINEQVKLEKELSEERYENQNQITEAVLKAQEQERAHIGRELHDNINQILATSRLYIEYAQKTPEMHDMLLFKARDFILSAIQEIRSLSKSVLPPSISDVGLAASLDDLLDTIREINHFKFETVWKIKEELLSPNLKLTIFRIVQEQLNNIIRHAKAKNVSISIKSVDDKVTLLIKDDGVGFEKGKESNGVGLRNIESRAALFNGKIDIDSTPGKGTILKVDFFLSK